MEWMLLPLKRYAEVTGRSRRKEFWLFFLFAVVVMAVAMILDGVLGLGGTITSYRGLSPTGVSAGFNSTGGLLTVVAWLALIIPSIALSARRLHDVDKSGWLQLIGLIPLAGLYLLYLYVQPGTHGPNRYGPDPLAEENP